MENLCEIKDKDAQKMLGQWRKLHDKISKDFQTIKEIEQKIFAKFDQPNVKHKDMAIIEDVISLPLDVTSIENALKVDLSPYYAKTIEKKIVILCK